MRFYAFFLLFLCSISLVSQNCDSSLKGRIIDLHDGAVLAGATLIISENGKAVQSDLDGNYSFTGLCNETYSIQVSHPECITRGFKVSVSGVTERDFKLEHHLEELNQVLVEGKSYQVKATSISENRINDEELDRYSSGSLGDALNSISGVSSLNTGNTVVKPLINGLHSSRVVIINNGVRMEDQEWGAEHAPNLDINSTGSISLIKGAGALKYSGDAVGGVIITEPEKIPVKDSLFGKTIFSAASNGRGTSVTSELIKSYDNGWYAKIQGTLKRFGDFEAPDYVLSNTGIFERNASLRVGLNRFDYGFEAYYSLFKNEIGILRASHLGGAQDQINAINSDRPLIVRDFTYNIDAPKQDVTHHLARLKAFKNFEDLGKLTLNYNFQRNNRLEFDIRRGDDASKASLDLELDTHSLELDLETDITSALSLNTGILGRYQNNFANPNTGVRRLIPDYEKYDLGIFAVASYELNKRLALEAGARYDFSYMDVFKFYRRSFWESRNYDELYPDLVVEETTTQILTNPQPEFHNFSATGGFSYNLWENYSIFFNYSLAQRAPNPSELYSEGLHHSASRIELGDLGFQQETAHKIGATFKRTSRDFSFSIFPYLNTINDFILIEPTGVQQTIRGNFQVWEYRQTDARLLGLDIDASAKLFQNLRFNHQFSLVKGYDTTRDEPLINLPAVNTTNELVYLNPKLNNLRLGLKSEYVFAQNEYPDNNFEVFIPETGTTEVVDVSTPPDAYGLVHFNSSIDLPLNNGSNLNIGFNINNLLNTSYRNYLNRLRYYADDLGRNLMLNLKLNY